MFYEWTGDERLELKPENYGFEMLHMSFGNGQERGLDSNTMIGAKNVPHVAK